MASYISLCIVCLFEEGNYVSFVLSSYSMSVFFTVAFIFLALSCFVEFLYVLVFLFSHILFLVTSSCGFYLYSVIFLFIFFLSSTSLLFVSFCYCIISSLNLCFSSLRCFFKEGHISYGCFESLENYLSEVFLCFFE